jgi:Glycosyl hydrolase family 65 central catalytic domain
VIRVWEGGGSLPTKGWPVLKGIADFWVSRATRNSDGSYSIDTVIPPDEYVEQVDDSVYTNVGARDSLRFAVQAAGLVGQHASPKWSQVADGLRVLFDSTLGIHPEYAGYPGDAVKQADATPLAYPWENAQSATVTRADLDYYCCRRRGFLLPAVTARDPAEAGAPEDDRCDDC